MGGIVAVVVIVSAGFAVILAALVLWGRAKARVLGTPFGGPNDPRDFCPCGCGTSIGMSRRGFSLGAAQAMALSAQAHDILDPVLHSDHTPHDDRREHEKFLANTSQIAAWFLEHVHGTAGPGRTPNGMELRRALQLAQGDVARLQGR